MNIYYLYIKTHKITGLKYLGQTKSNPFTYTGSGTDWKKHLTINGNLVDTAIIKECKSKKELNYWGRYYSNYYRITSAQDDFGFKIWANRIPETGGGHGNGNHLRGKKRLIESNNKTSKSMIKKWQNKDYKNNTITKIKQAYSDTTLIEKLKIIRKNVFNRESIKNQRSINTKISWNNETSKNKRITALKLNGKKPEFKYKMSRITSGPNNPSFDKTVYMWLHISGIIEKMTRYDFIKKYNLSKTMTCRLVKGKNKTHKGWQLIK